MEITAKHFRKREAIYECLRSTTTHPTAEWIYARLKPDYPDISLGTVYRNLALFKRQGIAQSVAVVDGSERFDANTDPHVHFICTACGRVDDLPGICVPEALCAEAEVRTGGRTERCCLSFYGLCRDCRAAREKET